jgi:hypothetical protein
MSCFPQGSACLALEGGEECYSLVIERLLQLVSEVIKLCRKVVLQLVLELLSLGEKKGVTISLLSPNHRPKPPPSTLTLIERRIMVENQ